MMSPILAQLAATFPELSTKLASLSDRRASPQLGDQSALDLSALSPARLMAISDLLRQSQWSRQSQISVLRAILDELDSVAPPLAESVEQWIRFHDIDDAEAIIDCIQLVPPTEVTIIGRLPRTGSQKIVYRANWTLQQKTVILKKLLFPAKLSSELRSHPLSVDQVNIIKTYNAQNSKGEIFLIEEFLDNVLNDNWPHSGIEQTALLTHDIASALQYIERQALVHGDVKPDNIGFHHGRFILLDFGLCRPASDFVGGDSATGSLRTRAPELFTGEAYHSIASDIWALGAVIARIYGGRFPLIENQERVPRISHPSERNTYEEKLRIRVLEEYDQRVTRVIGACQEPRIGEILSMMLSRNPADRPSPGEIVQIVKDKVGYAIPESDDDAPLSFSPLKEVEILCAEWPDVESLKQLSPLRLHGLKKYAQSLSEKLKDAPHKYQEISKALVERLART